MRHRDEVLGDDMAAHDPRFDNQVRTNERGEQLPEDPSRSTSRTVNLYANAADITSIESCCPHRLSH